MQQTGEDDLRNFADKIEMQLRNEQHTNNAEPFESQPNSGFDSQDIRNDGQQPSGGVNNGQFPMSTQPVGNPSAPTCSYIPKFLRDRDILASVVISLLFYTLTRPSIYKKIQDTLKITPNDDGGLTLYGTIATIVISFLLVLIILKIVRRIV